MHVISSRDPTVFDQLYSFIAPLYFIINIQNEVFATNFYLKDLIIQERGLFSLPKSLLEEYCANACSLPLI